MKTYTSKVLEATARLSDRTYLQSTDTVRMLTHPSPKVARIGSNVGLSIGVVLTIVGGIAWLSGAAWGAGSLSAGTLTAASNLIYRRKLSLGKR